MLETKTDKSLNEIFDVDSISDVDETEEFNVDELRPALPSVALNDNEQTEADNAIIKKDVTDDYEFTRNNYKNLIRRADSLLELVLRIAESGEDPKSIDVATKVINQVSALNTKLLDLTQRKQDVYNKTRLVETIQNTANSPTQSNTQVNAQNVTNVQFYGSTEELAQLIKETKKENENDSQ